MPMAGLVTEKTHKLRKNQKPPAHHKPSKSHKSSSKTPKTTAKPLTETKQDLTLSDWLKVFAYAEANPAIRQIDIVRYFVVRPAGALVFTQSALSKKLKQKDEMKARATSTPNALSAKRARVVTRPDVERALVLWQEKMESKNESVTGAMLAEKRKRFEDLFDVPERERLTGTGWMTSFKHA
ncbi:hypothetical protein AAF712_008790, partial [Marasmius tenuissimus]